MNLRAVLWLLGRVLLLLAVFQLVPVAVAGLYGEWAELQAFAACALVTTFFGAVAVFRNRSATQTAEGRPDFFRREGLAAVGVSWIVVPILGALPYLATGVAPAPIDALFESVSGFTTTGATILSPESIDGLPRSVGLWRSFTHWLGGIGIVLVFVLLFPLGGRSLFRSEVPGIAREASAHRVRDAAYGLARTYLALTLIEMGLLMLCGLDLLEATNHAFSTVSTGGFSTHSESIAYYTSWAIEAVLVVFMLLAGVNFGFYDNFLRGNGRNALRAAFRSSELRAYLGLMLAGTLIVAFFLWFWGGSNGDPIAAQTAGLPDYSSLMLSLRDASFAVAAVQTSTGFATADFDRWPDVCRMLLMFLAFVGACAGSTGGGLKVVRFLIVAKAAFVGVQRFSRPRAIYGVRINGESVDDGLVESLMAYFGLWFLVFLVSAVALTGMGMSLVGASTASLAALNNIGPGLEVVGPAQNFGALPGLAKALLGVLMLLGRLEFYALVVLIVPRFWRS